MNYFMVGIGILYVFAGIVEFSRNKPLAIAYFALTVVNIAMSMVK